MSSFECKEALREVELPSTHIGVLGVCLAFVCLLGSAATLIGVKFQSAEAKRGNATAARNVIFPIFVWVMRFSAGGDILFGIVYSVLDVDFYGSNELKASIAIGAAWGLQHFVIFGIAFLLIEYGCGYQAGLSALLPTTIVSVISAVVYSIHAYYGPRNDYAFAISISWTCLQIIFFGAYWLGPRKLLFRRDALLSYSRYWFILRSLAAIGITLEYVDDSSGACVDVFGTLVLFVATKPIIIYLTLLRDSYYWQGLYDDDSRANDDDDVSIRSPLMGVDIPLDNAQTLAEHIDQLPTHVKLINFAFLSIHEKKMLGAGSSSKVFSGTFQSHAVAVKLLYSFDLTREVIGRCCREATLLSSLKSSHVVHIYGIAVKPPAVCIVLEHCELLSLSEVLRGYPQMQTSEKLSLSWADRLMLCSQCAAGIDAIHAMNSSLCHRDVKSHNFLVDRRLNVKIADLELGRESRLNEYSGGGCNWCCCSSCKSSRHPSSSSSSFSQSLDHTRHVNDVLANWTAPEVLRGLEYTQASDIYSLSLVLWEIVSGGLIPFQALGNRDKVISSIISGGRPQFPPNIQIEIADLISECWNDLSSNRPSSRMILTRLKQLWKDHLMLLYESRLNGDSAAPIMVVSLSSSYSVSFVSDSYCDLTGCSREEIISSPHDSIYSLLSKISSNKDRFVHDIIKCTTTTRKRSYWVNSIHVLQVENVGYCCISQELCSMELWEKLVDVSQDSAHDLPHALTSSFSNNNNNSSDDAKSHHDDDRIFFDCCSNLFSMLQAWMRFSEPVQSTSRVSSRMSSVLRNNSIRSRDYGNSYVSLSENKSS